MPISRKSRDERGGGGGGGTKWGGGGVGGVGGGEVGRGGGGRRGEGEGVNRVRVGDIYYEDVMTARPERRRGGTYVPVTVGYPPLKCLITKLNGTIKYSIRPTGA